MPPAWLAAAVGRGREVRLEEGAPRRSARGARRGAMAALHRADALASAAAVLVAAVVRASQPCVSPQLHQVPARIVFWAMCLGSFPPAVARRLLLKKCDEARGRH